MDLLQDHCDSDECLPLLSQAAKFRNLNLKNLKDTASKGAKEGKKTVKNSKNKQRIENLIKEVSTSTEDTSPSTFEILPEKNKLEIITESLCRR